MSATFQYRPILELGPDATRYRHVTAEGVSLDRFDGREILKVSPDALKRLAQEAAHDASYFLRTPHLEQVAAILDDPEASENDRFVAMALLRNAEISAHGVLPFCQDTGTATVVAKKGQQVWTGGNDEAAIAEGIFRTYTEENLRYSQTIPASMYEEKNSGTNLPAQIDISAADGMDYKFLFVLKGGGSANKTFLYQETKALLNPASLEKFMIEKMKSLGTAACPPYHLVFVIGGTSAEACLKTVKLATAKDLEALPTQGGNGVLAFRDLELEARMLKAAQDIGIGAQFGGKYFALDVRIIRLPRHGASCPVGIGVSCSADRNIKAKINREGLWLEALDTNPGRFIPEKLRTAGTSGAVAIDLDQPMRAILGELDRHPVRTRLALTGTVVVARDIAHAKLKERIDRGEGLPDYIKNHPVYYAGPAKTPKGMASGSFGPTTAGRMDAYVDLFQTHGGSMVMMAKGNRSPVVKDACKKHGGFYLGSPGGPAALLAQEYIKKVEALEYPELGMEAVWKIRVENFPAFILIDNKGNDFFR